ncbi:MAG: ISL3 family transposase [Blastocatellales bacterium]|nr:ISL3 family transposase [Saprospiraceae bacterium]MCW5970330.1 ISL3 family transposase [Blastocatellales bacterium]
MAISIEHLLNIPGIRVLSVNYDEKKIECQIESTRGYSICHKCGRKASDLHEHEKELELRHLPICGRQVVLRLRPKRYRCPYCEGGVTTTERLDWYDAKAGCTKAYADFLLLELVNSTIQDVAKKHGVTYDLVRGALTRYVRSEVDWSQIEVLRILGLDEISLLKGHRDFVTIVSTQDKNGTPVLLAVLKGREKKTVVEFLKTIPERLREGVEEACSDLYEGFINAVEEVLPNAKVVADRFHVAKLYRAAVDELRKIEMKELKQVLKKEEYAGLKGVLWALRKKSEDLEPEERETLDLLFECSPLLRKAYRLREKLTRIFDNEKHTVESGRRAIRRWMAEVRESGLTCFDSFLSTLEERMDLITNYFISRSSSGWVEGLNNKIKVLKRRSYGIKNLANLFRRLWLDLNGYEAFAH